MKPYEVITAIRPPDIIENGRTTTSTAKPFIEAKTLPMSLEEIRDHHIIPVFAKF
jgi:hypothetical protein